MRRLSAIVAVGALALAACTPASAPSAETAGTVQPSSDATPVNAQARLVVLDGGGDVAVIESDGTIVAHLTDESGTGTAFQPVWSSDGRHIAYGESDDTSAAVVVKSIEGAEVERYPVPFPAFYLSWGPAGALSWLRNDPERRLAFEAVSAGGTRLTDGGSPFYYAWSPDGGELFAHVGSDRLETLRFDGAAEPAAGSPGAFPAPAWIDRGRLYLSSDALGQILVLEEGDDRHDVARIRGPAVFGAVGSRVAIRSFAPQGSGSPASFQEIPLVPANRLSVLDLDTGAITDVAGPRTAAFFWAPDGDRLLVLERAEGAPGALRWMVWTPAEVKRYGSFVPAQDWMLEFLPFFDQYAQSVRLWAPDGSAFAFPGTVDGRSGIWVQRLDAAEPEFVSAGTWVDWSPGGAPAL